MLTGIIIAVVISLIGAGIRALISAGQTKTNPIQNQINSAVFYELPRNVPNNLPIYLAKNNQPTGPYPPEQVLNWLNSGQLSPFDPAVRQGETQWQPLNVYFTARYNR